MLKSRDGYDHWSMKQYIRELCIKLFEISDNYSTEAKTAIQNSCDELIRVMQDLKDSPDLNQKYLTLILNCVIFRTKGI